MAAPRFRFPARCDYYRSLWRPAPPASDVERGHSLRHRAAHIERAALAHGKNQRVLALGRPRLTSNAGIRFGTLLRTSKGLLWLTATTSASSPWAARV
jgi:hypothetical protein